MKKSLAVAIVLTFASGLAGAAFLIGKRTAQQNSKEFVESISLQAIANDLLVLRFIERGEIEEAKKLLQGETNGSLSWVIESSSIHQSQEQMQQKCKILNTLKEYRAKRQLFTTKDWDYLWSVPGMKEEETKRQAFLSQLNCGDMRLFKIE